MAERVRFAVTAPSAKPRTARRPKFDKESSTTWLLAVLIGLGAGSAWQLIKQPTNAKQSSTPMQVLVVDTSGQVLAVLPSMPTSGSGSKIVQNLRPTLVQGKSKSASARSRAS